MRPLRVRLATTLLLAGVLAGPALVGSPALAADGSGGPVAVDGSTSGGDPYFPAAGNGGYDVRHYGLTIRYDPASRAFDAVARIRLTPTARLRSFSLDLRGLTARRVRVDADPASFRQAAGELVVRPTRPLAAGRTVVVTIAYGGRAGRPTDAEGVPYGWYSFADGAVVVSEPDGASTWFPANDVPSDKATVDLTLTVPQGKVAIGNGEQTGPPQTRDGWTTWSWSARDPMSTYLVTAAVGDYRVTRSRTPGGLPIIDAVDRDLPAAALATTQASLALQPQMIAFFERLYGPYPFSSFGSIVDDDTVGYALETQTRPVYSGVATQDTVAHELAHQWVGNSVGPASWREIWLNEGFASYSQWLWTEHNGGTSAQAQFDAVLALPAQDPFWDVVIADPGALGLFSAAVYDRGAATLHALRLELGDAAFFRLLRAWPRQFAGGSVTTADLVRLAERTSGRSLDAFFEAWVFTGTKPVG